MRQMALNRLHGIGLTILVFGLFWTFPPSAHAQSIADLYPEVKSFFPQADRFGELQGNPPAAPVYRGNKLLGFAFLSNDAVRIPAYSGRPINSLVGFDLTGRITGVRIVYHEEPILVVGVTEKQLREFVEQYRGISVFDRVTVGAERPGYVSVDTISGATITVMVENATIMRSVRQVAESRGLTLAGGAVSYAPAPVKKGAKRPAPPATVGTRAKEARQPQPSPGFDEEPVWVTIWRDRAFQIAVLIASLLLLILIMLFQDWLVRRHRLYEWVRHSFLVFTVFFIGWYTLAQLSVVNVLTFVHAVIHDFNWETFLLDPLIFILWGFVAVTLLLWGRGVYCGWLCPFGALQELTNHVARLLKVRQWEFPYVVHERLWALKYVILIILFGISLQSVTQAERYAEIEPFKTAILLRFDREWPFVVYALALIAISVVNRKFFCKYLCPLGAALVIPAQNRLFNWVRRRNECGKPCQVCAKECEVQAIAPTGEINKNECHYCLDCQVTYFNEYKCPPLVDQRKRRERRTRQLAAACPEVTVGAAGLGAIEVRAVPKNDFSEKDD